MLLVRRPDDGDKFCMYPAVALREGGNTRLEVLLGYYKQLKTFHSSSLAVKRPLFLSFPSSTHAPRTHQAAASGGAHARKCAKWNDDDSSKWREGG